MDAKGIMRVSGEPKVLRGEVYVIKDGKLEQLSGKKKISAELLKSDLMSSKRLRPIRAIYKKDEEETDRLLDSAEDV